MLGFMEAAVGADPPPNDEESSSKIEAFGCIVVPSLGVALIVVVVVVDFIPDANRIGFVSLRSKCNGRDSEDAEAFCLDKEVNRETCFNSACTAGSEAWLWAMSR